VRKPQCTHSRTLLPPAPPFTFFSNEVTSMPFFSLLAYVIGHLFSLLKRLLFPVAHVFWFFSCPSLRLRVEDNVLAAWRFPRIPSPPGCTPLFSRNPAPSHQSFPFSCIPLSNSETPWRDRPAHAYISFPPYFYFFLYGGPLWSKGCIDSVLFFSALPPLPSGGSGRRLSIQLGLFFLTRTPATGTKFGTFSRPLCGPFLSFFLNAFGGEHSIYGFHIYGFPPLRGFFPLAVDVDIGVCPGRLSLHCFFPSPCTFYVRLVGTYPTAVNDDFSLLSDCEL